MRTRLATLTAMVIAAAALVGSACTDDGSDESRSTTTRRATTTSTSAPVSNEPSDTNTSEPTSMDLGETDARVETLVVAGRTARGQVVGSVVVSIDFEGARTPDARRWEVDVATADGLAHEVEISADGTQVVRGPTPKTDSAADRTERIRRLAAATVDFEAATEIVAGRYPAGRITELDLDDSDGQVFRCVIGQQRREATDIISELGRRRVFVPQPGQMVFDEWMFDWKYILHLLPSLSFDGP